MGLHDVIVEWGLGIQEVGHIICPYERSTCKNSYDMGNNGRWKRERPMEMWRRTFLKDLDCIDIIIWNEYATVAVDQSYWRQPAVAHCA